MQNERETKETNVLRAGPILSSQRLFQHRQVYHPPNLSRPKEG